MMDAALLFWLAGRRRAKLPIPRWVSPVMVAGALASVGTKFTYDDQIMRFWNEIRDDWRAHEQMLAQDPRNGPTPSLPWCPAHVQVGALTGPPGGRTASTGATGRAQPGRYCQASPHRRPVTRSDHFGKVLLLLRRNA
jgi:hypothetical protein